MDPTASRRKGQVWSLMPLGIDFGLCCKQPDKCWMTLAGKLRKEAGLAVQSWFIIVRDVIFASHNLPMKLGYY